MHERELQHRGEDAHEDVYERANRQRREAQAFREDGFKYSSDVTEAHENRIRQALAMADLKRRVEEFCLPRRIHAEAEASRQDGHEYSEDVAEAHENRRKQTIAMADLKRRVEALTWGRA
jgi:hypothetical protein